MIVAGNYGYFRDELYYIDAGRHFQTGYVDFPPFIAWLAGILRLFGDNLVVLHFFSALANAALIVVTGLMARELGGGRLAQILAALASAAAVVFIGTGSLYTMDVFDELWWALAAYVFIRLVRREEPRLWLVFGLIAGIGLFTKLSMLFFGFALVVGLLLTPQRAMFRTRWPWLGGAIAFAFLLPYIGWQIQNGWPTPEFWRNYGGIENGSPLDFLVSQILTMNPLTLPLTIAGLVYYFRTREGKPYRALGWAFVILYVLFTHHTRQVVLPLAGVPHDVCGRRDPAGARLRAAARLALGAHRLSRRADASALLFFPGSRRRWRRSRTVRFSASRRIVRREAAGERDAAPATDPGGPLWLARDDRRRRGCLQEAAGGRARAGVYLHTELWRGGRDQLLWPEGWPATGDQWAQHLLALGTGKLQLARPSSPSAFRKRI